MIYNLFTIIYGFRSRSLYAIFILNLSYSTLGISLINIED